MLGIDQPAQGPDSAPDASRPEHGETSAARGTVLVDGSLRREYALAYRATVEAACAQGGREAETRQGGDVPPAADSPSARPSMAERYPSQYRKPDGPLPQVEGPGEDPARWVGEVYPGREKQGWPNNCGECARAVDSTWHGAPSLAAELVRRVGGERPAVMSEWAGRSPEPASMADIGQRLRDLGPGSSAVVGFDRKDAPGHWFNAVNHQGTILAVDGQSARVEKWPPTNDGLGFDESGMSYSDALYFTADGKAARDDHH